MWERGLLPRNTHFFHLYSDPSSCLPVLRDLRSSLEPEQDAFKLDESFLFFFFFYVKKRLIFDSSLKEIMRYGFPASRLVDVQEDVWEGRKKKKRD